MLALLIASLLSIVIYRRAVEPSTLTRCTETKSFHPERILSLTNDASTGLTVSLSSCTLPSFSFSSVKTETPPVLVVECNPGM